MIKNSLGRNSGKAIIEYGSEKHASEAIEHFDNRAVDNLVCNIRPFLAKGETSTRNEASLLSRRVYLMNIPYDTHVRELENLCKEFVAVEKIVLPRDPSGLARGYAFVYVKDVKEVQQLIDFVDGRHIRSRQVRAKSSLGGAEVALVKKELKPEDAEQLARYQKYSQNKIKANIRAENSDRHLSQALLRQVKRLQNEGYSESEATERVLHVQTQTVSEVTDPDYIQNLREVILDGAEAKEQFHTQIADYKTNYSKTYVSAKLQHLIKEKQGQSELEMYTGVPEAFATRKNENKMIDFEPRRYNVDEL